MINMEIMKTGKAKYSPNNVCLVSISEHTGNDCDQYVISKVIHINAFANMDEIFL